MRRYPVALPGVVFGLAAAAIELLEVGLVVVWSRLSGNVNPYGPQRDASNLILFPCEIAVSTLLFAVLFIAGAVAARHTGRVRSGLFAGLLAGSLDGVIGTAVLAVLTFVAPSILLAIYDKTVPSTGQGAFALLLLAEGFLARIVGGAVIGLWGGYHEKQRYRRRSGYAG